MTPPAISTFQDRIGIAIEVCGGRERGQSELARRINERYGKTIKPQTIQYLADKKRLKPATRSGLTPLIAEVTGLDAHWLATGELPSSTEQKATSGLSVPHTPSDNPRSRDKPKKPPDMDVTQQAVELITSWMELPVGRRHAVKAQIQAEAAAWRAAHAEEESPDEPLPKPVAPKRARPVRQG